jgi:hypothetical protein
VEVLALPSRFGEASACSGAVNEMRVCLQHTAKERELLQALARLGIGSFPPVWSEAWGHIRARTVAALATIRGEVRTLAPL